MREAQKLRDSGVSNKASELEEKVDAWLKGY